MRQPLTLKLLIVAIVTGVIFVALALINNVIDERQQYRKEAVTSIEASYAGPQTIIGPVLVRPYTQTTITVEDGPKGTRKSVSHTTQLTATSFPDLLSLRGTLLPSERRHGLYQVTVYELAAQLHGTVAIIQPQTTGTVVWGQPYLALSVSDVRGIVGAPVVRVNGRPEMMWQGADATMGWQPNLRVPLGGATALTGKLDFDIDLSLAGTERLSIAPVANSNHVELTSTWHAPLFAGQFLPRSSSVGAQGFHAAWDVGSLATATQVEMQASPVRPIDTLNVSLLTPIDPYKLSDRATKYGYLFVLLTFSGLFLFELSSSLPIHPVQYLLVGFGLAIFFLLLISFSEHIAFGTAYALASSACIGLLTFYNSYVLRSVLRGAGFGAMLTTVYAAVYGLLISEDNALVLGSLLLFAVLAAIMATTRRVDWYRAATPAPPPPPNPGLAG